MFWFIYKNDKQWLVYDWDVAKIDFCMDQLEAHVRAKSKPDNINFTKESFYVYWSEKKFDLPTQKKINEWDVDVTEDFIKYISNQARYKMLTDKVYWIRKEILKEFFVVKKWQYVCFVPHKKKKNISDSFKGKDKAWLIMMKELLDWDIRLEKYQFKYNGTEKEMTIWYNYNFRLFNKEILIPGNYTNALRQAMFKENVNIKRPDTNLTWLLQSRQYDVILRMGRVTAFVAPRRWWKTFLLAYLALKEIIKNVYTIQSRFRPISVLYLWLTAVKNYSVVQYMKKMVKQMGLGATIMFDWNPVLKSFEFKSGKDIIGSIKFIAVKDDDPGIGDYADCIIVDEAHKIPWPIVEWLMPIVQNEWAKLICASTLYPDLPKNWFYDLVVKWEANIFNIESEVENMYNKYEDLWKKLYDKTYTEEDTQRYSMVVEERINKIDYVWLRYNYDDIEYIPERRKEKTKKEEYEKNPRKFLISYYSRFPDEWKVFDYETSLKIESDVINAPYKYIILWYDPALTKDYAALKVMWYNPYQKKLADIEEHELKKTWRYEDQAEEISKIKERCKKYLVDPSKSNSSIFLVMDWTQKANAEVLEMKWLRVDCKVAATTWQSVNTRTDIRWEHTVPKKYLVELFQEMLDNRKIIINKELKRTIDEMWNFKTKLMASGYVKYEADTGTKDDEWKTVNDDFVSATLLCNYFACNVLGLKYYMFREDIWFTPTETSKMTRAELAKYHHEVLLNEKRMKELKIEQDKSEEYYQAFIY